VVVEDEVLKLKFEKIPDFGAGDEEEEDDDDSDMDIISRDVRFASRGASGEERAGM